MVSSSALVYYYSSGETFSFVMIFSNQHHCSKPIYDATLREPTAYELERAEFLKKRMQARGWWDNPFKFWKSSDSDQ